MTSLSRPVPPVRAVGQPADPAYDFDQLYQAHFNRVLAAAYALTGDRQAAQDLTQEAFCRAWQRWSSIQRYDDPLAWIRRVVTNLATSRWRRLAVVRLHQHKHFANPTPPLEPDHVAVVTALRTLPRPQRQAVVLHHLLDLPISDVARELGAAEGTVKSWLHRGRLALAAQLSDDPEEVGSDD